MKNLLLIFAIFIFACGSETEVAEESTPITEELELEPVSEQLPPTVDANADQDPPEILKPDFLRDDAEPFMRIDPVPFNRDGILFEFSEDLVLFKADFSLDGQSLGWLPREALTGDDIGDSITVTPPADGPFLEYDTKYILKLEIEDNAGWGREIETTVRTIRKP